jgi:methylmalonyl-CoA decarboxylase subunit alpha
MTAAELAGTLGARVTELDAHRGQILSGPDSRATAAQHAKGKLTARERISLLLDRDSFHEIEPFRRHRASGFGLEDRKPCTDGVPNQVLLPI